MIGRVKVEGRTGCGSCWVMGGWVGQVGEDNGNAVGGLASVKG